MHKILITAILLTMTAALGAQNKIPLSDQNIINISAKGNPLALVDEQDVAGDPLSGASGKPATVFTNGYIDDHLYYPLEVVVDLFAMHALSSCHYYDFEGIDTLEMYAGTPGSWRLLFKETTSSYDQWVGHMMTDTTRYLLIRVHSPETKITELVAYGEPLESVEPPAEPAAVKHPYPVMKDFIGTNSFVDVPMEFTKAVGFVREYHNWQWDEGNSDTIRSYEGYPNNAYGWNPSWVRGDNWAWNFDDYYSSLKDNDIGVCPTLQKTLPLMVDYNNDSLESKPVMGDDDPTDPASYAAHADWMFQFAARYGSREVDPSLIKTDQLNQKRSGLGLVSWMENWNEPDKWWMHRAGYFTPFEYAAMMSADYDGDLGSMGTTKGLKNADPSMKMAMSGLAGLDLEYVKAMMFWFEHFRNDSFPADALNFHHYSNDGGEGQSGTSTQGVSPEDDNLREKAAALVAYRNRHLPGKEVWVSEFGYDTNQESPIHAPSIGSMDEFTVQGAWIIRSYLELAAAGVDKAMQFMIRDVWGPSPGKFSSCGLITARGDTINGSYQPKKSWYYVYTFKKILGDYRFSRDLSTGDVRVYEFEHAADQHRKIAVLWSPTSSDHTIEGFRLNGLSGTVIEKQFLENDTVPAQQALALEDGAAVVDISEIPLFIEYTGSDVAVVGTGSRGRSATVMSLGAIQWSRTGLIDIRFTTVERGVINAALYTLNGRKFVTVSRSLGSGNHRLALCEGNQTVGAGAYIVKTEFISEGGSVEKSRTVMVMGR